MRAVIDWDCRSTNRVAIRMPDRLDAIAAPAVTSGMPTATSDPKVINKTRAAMPIAKTSEVCDTLKCDIAVPPNWT